VLSLDDIYIAYQPIWDMVNNLVFGYEAFLRGSLSTEIMLKDAVQEKVVCELDAKIHQLSIQTLPSTYSKLLFLNVHPCSLHRLLNHVDYTNFTGGIVLEITECERISTDVLIRFCEEAKRRNLFVAIDDFGAGYNNISVLEVIKPDFIKIDKSIIQSKSSRLIRNYIQLVLEWASENNTLIIAEGIETKQQLQFCKDLKIQYAQGFLLGKPSSIPFAQDVQAL